MSRTLSTELQTGRVVGFPSKTYDSDKNEKTMSNESAEFDTHKTAIYDALSQDLGAFKDAGKFRMEDTVRSEDFKQAVSFDDKGGTTGDVNMEVLITADEVMRAGGFGATDDIGTFLPAAIDSTDFEASLRDARDFEEPQGETPRPGLGWTESKESEDRSLA